MSAARPLRAALALCLALAALAAAAQTPAASPQRRAPARPPVSVPVPAPPPAADEDQRAAAAMAHLGAYECEFNEKVSVDLNPRFDAYVDVKHRNRSWIMKPVLSRTGALRLEDVRGRMLMLQIADKSMLMDTQVGQRVVDHCVHEKQREATAARKAAGTQVEALGIDPAKAAAAAPAASAN